jgi:hypothetical protein
MSLFLAIAPLPPLRFFSSVSDFATLAASQGREQRKDLEPKLHALHTFPEGIGELTQRIIRQNKGVG